MTQKQIKTAAKEHSLRQLGKEQFDNNKLAVQAISEDFIAGIKWCEKQFKKTEAPIKRRVIIAKGGDGHE